MLIFWGISCQELTESLMGPIVMCDVARSMSEGIGGASVATLANLQDR